MKGERNTDKNNRKFITIRDMSIWEQIDKLMTLPRYQKTFNGVINDALFFGLPELIKVQFGEVEPPPKKQFHNYGATSKEDGEFYAQTIRLMKEIILNAIINKSILSSLFGAKNQELKGKTVSGTAFERGGFRDTPEYLEDYEIRALKELR